MKQQEIRLITEKIYQLLIEKSLTLQEIWETYYQNLPYEEFKERIIKDPTYTGGEKMGKYGKWLINNINGNANTEEVKHLLSIYHRYSMLHKGTDINKIKGLEGLRSYVNNISSNEIKSEVEKKREEKENGAEKVYEDETWEIIILKTEEASCYYGKGTKWCTSGKKNNKFNFYNSQGDLYLNINKNTGRKYLFFFNSREFNDEINEPILAPVYKTIGLSEGVLRYYEKAVGNKIGLLLCDYITEEDKNGNSIILINHKYNVINNERGYIWKARYSNWFDYCKQIDDNYYLVEYKGENYYMDTKGELYQ